MTELTFRIPGKAGRLIVLLALVRFPDVFLVASESNNHRSISPSLASASTAGPNPTLHLQAQTDNASRVTTNNLHLPLASLLPILATVLPLLNIAGATHVLTTRTPGPFVRIILLLATIADTVLASLSASKLDGAGLTCPLTQQWQQYFREKDGGALQSIQDALDCCGLKNVVDMPFPFPAKGVNPGECARRTGRTDGCLEAWRTKEQGIAGMLFGIGVVLVVVKVVAIVAMGIKEERERDDSVGRIEEVDSDAEEVTEDQLAPSGERTPLLRDSPWADERGNRNGNGGRAAAPAAAPAGNQA